MSVIRSWYGRLGALVRGMCSRLGLGLDLEGRNTVLEEKVVAAEKKADLLERQAELQKRLRVADERCRKARGRRWF